MTRGLAMAFLCVLGWSGAAAAQPLVRVRAESRIELRTRRLPDAVVVEGVLRDDLGQPLPGRPVQIRIEAVGGGGFAVREETTTDARGEFRLETPLPIGEYLLRATFREDDVYQRFEAQRRLDLERADVRLRVIVPEGGRLDLDVALHPIEVIAESDEGGAGLSIQLLDELDRPLTEGTTDAEGHVAFVLHASVIGPPGAGRLKARSQPDARHAEAQTEVPIVRFRRTELILFSNSDAASPGDTIRFAGSLRDSMGPLDGKAVGLFARAPGSSEEIHLATTLTGAGGDLTAEAAIPPGLDGTVEVRARFQSDTPGRASSESGPVAIQVRGVSSTPWPWLLVPMAICALVLVVIARRTPKRLEKTAPPPATRPAGIEAAPRRGLLADRSDLAGKVLDARDDEALAGATIELQRAEGETRTMLADDQGRFAFETLEPGRWTLKIGRAGFAPEASQVNVPHRGEWSAVRIRLASLRSLALDRYRPVALAVLSGSREFGVWTTREILARARERGADPRAFGELTSRVERACYAASPPSPADVETIGTLGDEARSGLRAVEPAPDQDERPPR
jgi:hypothetical protein